MLFITKKGVPSFDCRRRSEMGSLQENTDDDMIMLKNTLYYPNGVPVYYPPELT